MTKEQLLDAIGQIDDDLITEAAVPVRRTPRRALIGLAAALVLCVGLLSLPALSPQTTSSDTAALAESASGEAENAHPTADQEFQIMADDTLRGEENTPKGPIPQASATAGKDAGVAAGVFEPRFITPRGTYLPIEFPNPEDSSPALPVDAVSLGTLQQYPCDDPSVPTTPTKSLVGCPVWESKDGSRLYIQLPDSQWLISSLCR